MACRLFRVPLAGEAWGGGAAFSVRPRESGTQTLHRQIGAQIAPRWIRLLDEPQFPDAVPFLQLTFARQCRLARFMLLVPNQGLNSVLATESRYRPSLMLPNSAQKIVGHTDVKSTVPSARENVDEEAHVTLLGPAC